MSIGWEISKLSKETAFCGSGAGTATKNSNILTFQLWTLWLSNFSHLFCDPLYKMWDLFGVK